MARVRTIQASFAAGELSPTLLGRTDLAEYANGAQRLRNVYVTSQGGVFRREGTMYVDPTEGVSRLVAFQFSDVANYLLVFTEGKISVYRDRVKVHEITGAFIEDITEDMLPGLNWTQSYDVLILVHPDMHPLRITRGGNDTTWTVDEVPFTHVPSFLFGSVTETNKTSTISLVALPQPKRYTLTSNAADFPDDSVIGANILSNNGIFEITARISTTVVEVTVLSEPSSFANSTRWILETGYEPVWSETRGYPRAVTFFQGRLWFGGSRSLPQAIWGSRVGGFFDFLPAGGLPDDTLFIAIDDDRVNIIRNLFPGRTLQVFTSGSEFFVVGGSADQAITPTNIQVRLSTSHGSGHVRPLSVDGATIFVERRGGVVREFVFSEVEQSHIANSLSLLAPHLIRSPVAMDVRRSSTRFPADYVYLVNGDGTVAVMNSLRAEKLLAWTLFETDGIVTDVSVLGDEVYFTVVRQVGGQSVRYLEVLDENTLFDCSSVQTSLTPTDSWSGLEHLAERMVGVSLDRYLEPSKEVEVDGTLQTVYEGERLDVGLPFFALVRTVPIDGLSPSDGQPVTGRYKSLVSVMARLYESRGMIVRRTENNGTVREYKPTFRSFGERVLDQPVSLFTGLRKVYIGGINRDSDITVTQDGAYELNILSLIMEVST